MKYKILLLPPLLVFALLLQVRQNEAKDAIVSEAMVNRQLLSKPEHNVRNTLVKKSQECRAESNTFFKYHLGEGKPPCNAYEELYNLKMYPEAMQKMPIEFIVNLSKEFKKTKSTKKILNKIEKIVCMKSVLGVLKIDAHQVGLVKEGIATFWDNRNNMNDATFFATKLTETFIDNNKFIDKINELNCSQINLYLKAAKDIHVFFNNDYARSGSSSDKTPDFKFHDDVEEFCWKAVKAIIEGGQLTLCTSIWDAVDQFGTKGMEKNLQNISDGGQKWFDLTVSPRSYIGTLDAKEKVYEMIKDVQTRTYKTFQETKDQKEQLERFYPFGVLLTKYLDKKYGKFDRDNYESDKNYIDFKHGMKKIFEKSNIKPVKVEHSIMNNIDLTIVGMWEKIRYAAGKFEAHAWTTFHPMASKIFIETKDNYELPCSVPDKGCGDCKKRDDCWRVKGLSFFYNIMMSVMEKSNDRYKEDIKTLQDFINNYYYRHEFYGDIFKNTDYIKNGINTIKFDFIDTETLKKELESVNAPLPGNRRRLLNHDVDKDVLASCNEVAEALGKNGNDLNANLMLNKGSVLAFECVKGNDGNGICKCLKTIAEKKSEYKFVTTTYELNIKFDEDRLRSEIKDRKTSQNYKVKYNNDKMRPERKEENNRIKGQRRRLLQRTAPGC